MLSKNVLCPCGKRFVSNRSMDQHRRASTRHITMTLAPVPVPRLEQQTGGLSLQTQEVDHDVRFPCLNVQQAPLGPYSSSLLTAAVRQ